ncbi:unnamed protein product [Mesocestoides corti]|uniref:Uncharacterized protein n=2 Tax=Mesocestoides corti TaxID=53468 RepID=A0A0R3UJX0_MESCO|nr:unnamed protein product [Mesocestoides corti]
MAFGHTDYVPPDETRNFKALFSLSDNIKEQIDTKPSVVLHIDPELYPPELVSKYEENVKGHPLPAKDYRKLMWGASQQSIPEIDSTENTPVIPSEKSTKQQKSTEGPHHICEAEVTTLPAVEARYRGMASIPFRTDQMACHLIDQPAMVSQTRKLKARLGHDTIRLNDPVYADWLRELVQREMENEEEGLCLKREGDEVLRTVNSKKLNKSAANELFKEMRLPELCSQKPWIWSSSLKSHAEKYGAGDCKYDDGDFESRSVSSSMRLPPIHQHCPKHSNKPCRSKKCLEGSETQENDDELEALPPIQCTLVKTDDFIQEYEEEREEEEGDEEEDNEEGMEEEGNSSEACTVEKLSEMTTVTQLFSNADCILNNPKVYTKLTLNGEYVSEEDSGLGTEEG